MKNTELCSAFHVEEYAVIVSVVKEVHLMQVKHAIIFRYLYKSA